MKEKTDNIDILERLEYFEPDDLVECVMYRECIEGVKTLIAENKELKEIVETLRKENVEAMIQRRKYELHYIPKSKVEEEIHYLKECKDFAKTGKFKEAQIQTELLETVIKKLEQSLLGKE